MKKILLFVLILMALPSSAQVSPSTTATFPQIASGPIGNQSIITEIIVVNPGGGSARVDIELFNSAGGRLDLTMEDIITHHRSSGSFQTVVIESQGTKVIRTISGGSLKVGHALLRSNQAISATGRYFFLEPDGSVAASVGVGSSEAIRDFIIPVIYDRTAQLNTGIAVADATLSAMLLRFTLLDSNGRTVRTETHQIGPGGHFSKFATEIFSSALQNQDAFIGAIRVQTDRPVSAVALLAAGSNKLSSLPVTMLAR